MSVSDKFREKWIAKFPDEAVPKDLKFLLRPRDIVNLETCLDECIKFTFQLKAELEHQELISQFILELMDNAKNVSGHDDDGGGDSVTAELGDGLSRSRLGGEKTSVGFDSDSNKCFKECDISSYDIVEYGDEARTYSFESPLPRRPGAFKGFLDRVKSAGVVRTTSEPNIAGSKSDRPNKSTGALPQNHGMVSTGHSSFLNLSTGDPLKPISNRMSEKSEEEPSAGKRGQSSITEQTLIESSGKVSTSDDPTEPRSISLPLLATVDMTGNLSPGREPAVHPRRQRRVDLYEEAIPFERNLKSEYGQTILSDEEHEDETNHIYYNILLLKQQTLDRAKMLYFNEEEEPVKKLERQARKLSLRYNQAEKRHANGSKMDGPIDESIDPVAMRRKRQSMINALSDLSEGHSDVDELDGLVAPLFAAEDKLLMRKSLIVSILDSEQDYVEVLDILLRYMQTFRNLADTAQCILSLADIEAIFLKIPDLHRIHYIFIHALRPKVEKWSNEQEVAEIFHQLAEEEYRIAPAYLKNYQTAINTVKKCYQENPQFLSLTKDIHVKGAEKTGKIVGTLEADLLQQNSGLAYIDICVESVDVRIGLSSTLCMNLRLFMPMIRFEIQFTFDSTENICCINLLCEFNGTPSSYNGYSVEDYVIGCLDLIFLQFSLAPELLPMVLLMQDLINYTPPGHADYDLLQKTHKVAQKFLSDFENPSGKETTDYQRYLVKHDNVVEKVGAIRKLRHIFLFNDFFVCTRQKLSTKQRVSFEAEWFIPLADLSFSVTSAESDEIKNPDIEPIRRKVINLQSDLKVEMKRAKASEEFQRKLSFRTHTKNMEKIKKKLLEQKAALILESPNLEFAVKNDKYNKTFCLLLSSDYERTSWSSAIQGLRSKNMQPPINLSTQDLNTMLNNIQLPRMSSMGALFGQDDICLEEEYLFGSLTITIRSLRGLKQPSDTFCCVEVDSFGHFLMQAKTKVIYNSSEPNWDEDFDIDLEGAQTLRVLLYRIESGQSQLIGKNAYELSNNYLKRAGQEEDIIINEMSLSLFLIYRSREQTLKRTLSLAKEGLFGVRIRAVTRREGSRMPLIVTACIEEVESRGMQDVGIYRISGLSSEIQRLKKAFEKNSRAAVSLLKGADINVVTGLLKMYLRELPEALFTDDKYAEIVKGMSFSDPEAKEKYMLNVIRRLPEPNYSTAMFIMDHLVRVSTFKDKNKMTLQNLATVFGPTLLRPAVKDGEKKPANEMFIAGAREALMQVAVLQHLMNLRAKAAIASQT